MDELAILRYLDRLPTSIDILHLALTVALILMKTNQPIAGHPKTSQGDVRAWRKLE